MDGGSRIGGGNALVEFNGRTLKLRPRTAGFYWDFEAWILSRRGDPFELLIEAAKQEGMTSVALSNLAMVVSQSFKSWRNVTWQELVDIKFSPRGECYQIWWCLQDNDSPPTLEKVTEVVMEDAAKNGPKWKSGVLGTIEQISGDSVLGNSTGPQPQVEAGKDSTGSLSSTGSEKSEAGQPETSTT